MELRGGSVGVLVTGASGFIGGRLAEVLSISRGVRVSALVRDFSRVARLGRSNIRLVRGDLRDADSLRRALDGVDYVFHCAYAHADRPRAERDVNVDATVALVRLARERGVKRLVYTGSMAVYGQDLPPQVDERTPYRPTTAYGRVKRDVERSLTEASRAAGVSLVVAQPTKVYGPYDFTFTVPFVGRLAARRLWLIEAGSGLVSPGYVDNVVHGLIRCAEVDRADGGVYIVADGVTVTWAEFVSAFSALCGATPRGSVTRAECASAWAAAARAPSPARLLRSIVFSREAVAVYGEIALYRWLRRRCPDRLIQFVRRRVRPVAVPEAQDRAASPPELPSAEEYRDFMRKGAYSIRRAQEELGFRPALPLTEGVARTVAWLRYAGILEGGPLDSSGTKLVG